MKTIHTDIVVTAVAKICIDANYYIGNDIKTAFHKAKEIETDSLSRDVIVKLIENSEIAAERSLPICQDTGMAVVFVEIGQDVKIEGGLLSDAINLGVAKGYRDGYLRKSVVKDPISRINTNDNTPAIIHYDIVGGDGLKITVAPKGFGSENMSSLKMLQPSDGIQGVKDFIIETVKNAGPNPCPPIIVGAGVGGTMDKACIIAKQALLREVGSKNSDEYWSNVEEELLNSINALGIGPAGFGGKTTALAVHINTFATHIAGLPVAVNVGCHVTRHKDIIL